MYYYLYRITNTLNGKVYIGQSKNDKYRWRQHCYFAKNPERTGQHIHRAMAKYGVENFVYEIIATCRTQEDTDETESLLIQQYDSRNKEHGYNLKTGGSYGGHSEETKRKMSELAMGENNSQYGTKRSDEWKQMMSQVHKGTHKSEETRKKMSEKAKQNRAVINKPGRRKLSPEQTQAILVDTRSRRIIAKEYGVDRELIATIKKRGN